MYINLVLRKCMFFLGQIRLLFYMQVRLGSELGLHEQITILRNVCAVLVTNHSITNQWFIVPLSRWLASSHIWFHEFIPWKKIKRLSILSHMDIFRKYFRLNRHAITILFNGESWVKVKTCLLPVYSRYYC
jgi:hypothetical protein